VKNSVISILILLIAGCAAKPVPEVKQYLLRASIDNASVERAGVAKLTLGKVSVAAYLDQPGLALQRKDGSMSRAHHHLWAEPLRESLRIYLSTEISKRSGRAVRAKSSHQSHRYTLQLINIDIDELHGNHLGEARLVGRWNIVDAKSGEILSERRFVSNTPLLEDGYQALILAEKHLLQQFSQDIAEALSIKE